ncbi:MAG: anti-sigma factor [Gammaproteobacteria bacterium]|nr:anti-sigma factor [Gammaproteobacteria bacterium]
MDCRQLQQCIDDYLDGVLPAGEQDMARQHLSKCKECQSELNQIQELRQALRALPVPAPGPGFTSRMLEPIRQQQRRKNAVNGLISALAASLVIWLGVHIMPAQQPDTGVDAIAMSISEVRNVSLVFRAPDAFNKVTMQLELDGNIELAGYQGKTELEWQTTLKKGANTLVLPIKAIGSGDALVTARIKHQGKTRIFRIPVKIDRTKVQLRSPEVFVSA